MRIGRADFISRYSNDFRTLKGILHFLFCLAALLAVPLHVRAETLKPPFTTVKIVLRSTEAGNGPSGPWKSSAEILRSIDVVRDSSAEETTTTRTAGGQTTTSRVLEIRGHGKLVKIDLDAKQSISIPLPFVEQPWADGKIYLDLKRRGERTVAGRSCKEYADEHRSVYCVWEGLLLRQETSLDDRHFLVEAISIEENAPIEASRLAIPAEIAAPPLVSAPKDEEFSAVVTAENRKLEAYRREYAREIESSKGVLAATAKKLAQTTLATASDLARLVFERHNRYPACSNAQCEDVLPGFVLPQGIELTLEDHQHYFTGRAGATGTAGFRVDSRREGMREE